MVPGRYFLFIVGLIACAGSSMTFEQQKAMQERTINASYDYVFQSVTKVLMENGLSIFEAHPGTGLIMAQSVATDKPPEKSFLAKFTGEVKTSITVTLKKIDLGTTTVHIAINKQVKSPTGWDNRQVTSKEYNSFYKLLRQALKSK